MSEVIGYIVAALVGALAAMVSGWASRTKRYDNSGNSGRAQDSLAEAADGAHRSEGLAESVSESAGRISESLNRVENGNREASKSVSAAAGKLDSAIGAAGRIDSLLAELDKRTGEED